MTQDEKYMYRCIELARKGSPHTWPNPLVGSVVVHQDKIIGEGYHEKLGGNHAEVNAIEAVEDRSLLKFSTLYVNLEPCSHHGKTPPCADLIIRSGIPRVVCAMTDPNKQVAGSGIKRLIEAGIDVCLGVLEKEAQELNRSFVFFHRNGRPFIVLKWARTANGFMGRTDSTLDRQISASAANVFVHKLRSESGAIVVGKNTVRFDDPSLTTRLVDGRSPHRIVLAHTDQIPAQLKVKADGNPTTFIDNPESCLNDINQLCLDSGYTQVLVEGGAEVLNFFLNSEQWNEAYEIVSPIEWADGIPAPEMSGKTLHGQILMGPDQVNRYINHS